MNWDDFRQGIPKEHIGRALSEKDVSRITGISQIKLRNDRWQRKGLPYVKTGKRVTYWWEIIYRSIFNNMIEHGER